MKDLYNDQKIKQLAAFILKRLRLGNKTMLKKLSSLVEMQRTEGSPTFFAF